MIYRRDAIRNYFLSAVSACLLSGCIVVDDFGDYWKKGYVDTCVNDIVLSDIDGKDDKAGEMQLRSLNLGGHTFIMIREHQGDKGGDLIRYDIKGGQYISYRLNDSKRDDFLHYYPGSSVTLTTETATIPVLNDDAAALLSRLADDNGYWIENSREPYNPKHRNDCTKTP